MENGNSNIKYAPGGFKSITMGTQRFQERVHARSNNFVAPLKATIFNPLTIPGLVAWFDAADLSTFTAYAGNSTVATWKSKDGNVNQSGTNALSNGPTVLLNALGPGKNGVVYTGAGTLQIQVPPAPSTSPFTIYAVWSGTSGSLFAASTPLGLQLVPTGTAYATLGLSAPANTSIPNTMVYERIDPVTFFSNMYVNSPSPIVTGFDTLTQTAPIINLGGSLGGGPLGQSNLFTGTLYELLISQGTVQTPTMNAAVIAYLRAKWGTP